MAPRARPQLVELSPDVEAHVREGVEQAERGEFAPMSPLEKQRYLETGELPEHVKQWLASPSTPSGT
jgi:predicted transcriptional regulator